MYIYIGSAVNLSLFTYIYTYRVNGHSPLRTQGTLKNLSASSSGVPSPMPGTAAASCARKLSAMNRDTQIRDQTLPPNTRGSASGYIDILLTAPYFFMIIFLRMCFFSIDLAALHEWVCLKVH